MDDSEARAVALRPPRAGGKPPACGVLRAEPEDFLVEEELGFTPAGSGQHLLLRVRKRDANTQWVARELARIAGCRTSEIGYAGLKDRRAIAVQWFSAPRTREASDWQAVHGAGFEVLEAQPHHRKLPRGALAGNRFVVRIREPAGDGGALAALLAPRLAQVAREGVPNYFGPQRFGRQAANIDPGVVDLLRLPLAQRGFVLSAARSVIFNAVLAARVTDGSWNQLVPGELANLDGRGSVFAVADPDATLIGRCRRLEIHPTGPLWGSGTPATSAVVLELETRVAARFALQCALCAAAGMEQQRRSLRIAVHELACVPEERAVVLRFRLARGCFATAVLRELVDADLG